MSRRCTVVVEGRDDAILLGRLLDRQIAEGVVRLKEAGGRSAAESLARTVVAIRREPAVLVADADATEPEDVETARQYLEGALGMVGPAAMWRVVLAVPTIEVCLFQDSAFALALVGHELSQAERALAEVAPKRLLEMVGPGGPGSASLATLVPALTDDQLTSLRRTPLISKIIGAIGELTHALAA